MNDAEHKLWQEASNIVEARTKRDVFRHPLQNGLVWAVFASFVLAVYEGIQFSSFEFQPDTRLATAITVGLAFLVGLIDQRQAQSRHQKDTELLVRQMLLNNDKKS